MAEFSHTDSNGKAQMVDISNKSDTHRTARASVVVRLDQITFGRVKNNEIEKGEVIAVARVAGIQAAKKTSDLIPLCHSLSLSHVDIEFELDESSHTVLIGATVKTTDKTGVEMEALTACSVAALTIYDMVKASQKDVVIDDLKLLEKTGGKSGEFKRTDS